MQFKSKPLPCLHKASKEITINQWVSGLQESRACVSISMDLLVAGLNNWTRSYLCRHSRMPLIIMSRRDNSEVWVSRTKIHKRSINRSLHNVRSLLPSCFPLYGCWVRIERRFASGLAVRRLRMGKVANDRSQISRAIIPSIFLVFHLWQMSWNLNISRSIAVAWVMLPHCQQRTHFQQTVSGNDLHSLKSLNFAFGAWCYFIHSFYTSTAFIFNIRKLDGCGSSLGKWENLWCACCTFFICYKQTLGGGGEDWVYTSSHSFCIKLWAH